MRQEDELVLKVTKEVVIKFIEIGRLSVNSFDEVFKQIHETVYESLQERTLAGELNISKEDKK
ncbi:conjugal transfer protein TraB [Thermodesulfobacteriota bacterium]